MSGLLDFREIPLAEVANIISPDMRDTIRRVMPLSTDPERPAVSAFNSSF
jgi:FXSXX-COOH protein